jgi:hypothetical protein
MLYGLMEGRKGVVFGFRSLIGQKEFLQRQKGYELPDEKEFCLVSKV